MKLTPSEVEPEKPYFRTALGNQPVNHFQKKGECSSLSISEIIDSKWGGYLSAWKALLQNSFG